MKTTKKSTFYDIYVKAIKEMRGSKQGVYLNEFNDSWRQIEEVLEAELLETGEVSLTEEVKDLIAEQLQNYDLNETFKAFGQDLIKS